MKTPALVRLLASPVLFALLVWGHLVLPGLAFAPFLAMVYLITLGMENLLGMDMLPRLPTPVRIGRADDGR